MLIGLLTKFITYPRENFGCRTANQRVTSTSNKRTAVSLMDPTKIFVIQKA